MRGAHRSGGAKPTKHTPPTGSSRSYTATIPPLSAELRGGGGPDHAHRPALARARHGHMAPVHAPGLGFGLRVYAPSLGFGLQVHAPGLGFGLQERTPVLASGLRVHALRVVWVQQCERVLPRAPGEDVAPVDGEGGNCSSKWGVRRSWKPLVCCQPPDTPPFPPFRRLQSGDFTSSQCRFIGCHHGITPGRCKAARTCGHRFPPSCGGVSAPPPGEVRGVPRPPPNRPLLPPNSDAAVVHCEAHSHRCRCENVNNAASVARRCEKPTTTRGLHVVVRM
eukprot:1189583-Prorocentrum_minimum.AAC.2